jgi:hypothetical protein
MLSKRARFLALWRGFRASSSPFHRRLFSLVLCLLPLPVRRVVVRVFWACHSCLPLPRWLVRLASDVAGYLFLCSGALSVLWLWSRC